jgi:hypothetical protein
MESAVAQMHNVLRREPFAAGAGHLVFVRAAPGVLNLILEGRLLRGERESEVTGLLGASFFLLDRVHDVHPLDRS